MNPASTRFVFARRLAPGFTLIELLVVLAVIVALAVMVFSGLSGTGRSAALQSSQALLTNGVSAARTRAMASGLGSRLLVHVDPASANAAERYMRYLVLQVNDGIQWRTLTTFVLPAGTALLPRDLTLPGNIVVSMNDWTRPSDGLQLRSSALRAVMTSYPDALVSLAINSVVVEQWAAIKFTPAGTTQNTGDLIVASTIALNPSLVAQGDSPFQFIGPDAVRGVSITQYGLPLQINGREGF